LVIRVSRDPAEKTSTSPLALAAAGLEELAGLAESAELGALAALEELEEELLQAARPTQAIDTNAAICAPRR
jgi:hypothetical protein